METSPQFAGELGIESLYHYQDFDLASSDDHVGRLTDILKHHRIWCSNPANFNDPWDCKPYFDTALLEDPQIRAATAESLISYARKAGTALNHDDEKLRNDLEFLKDAVSLFTKNIHSFIPERWGVYCLSPDPCISLMWSHYARDHKGICLEFVVPDTKFRSALQVQYQKEYPAFLLHDQNIHFKIVLVKSDDWIYEREFRLICPRFTDVKQSPLIMDGNHLQIGPEALISIIMGCQIEDEARKTIRKLVKEHAPHVRVCQAMRSMNKYRLIISPGAALDK
jgi:Protein of unknown function (DUF2971)